jgi:beta-xylosidase
MAISKWFVNVINMRGAFLIVLFLIISIAGLSQQLVLPGAHPDPSIVKVDDGYWASATSSNWLPAFPLLHSKDLRNWEQKGYIFYNPPAWADYYFWAPELEYDSGRVYVYYTAHKKNGNLCIAVASADKPEGPYKDHGPLICQEYGSIDAFPIRDTSGRLFLVWKEDANSVNKPTPIWAQQINEERTQLVGDKVELFRNDAPWEKELVEGVSIIKYGEYYYAFYAAAGCCGDRCTYVTGVARAKDITGPWEKYNRNPILVDDDRWLCKGHGTPIERNGKYYFFYHGFYRESSAFTGREGLLQEFTFTEGAWPQFVNNKTDSVIRQGIITDEFRNDKLAQEWQWSIFNQVDLKLNNDRLFLNALPVNTGSFIARKIASADYTATATVITTQSNAYAGIGAIGDEKNMVALVIKDFQLQIIKVRNGVDSIQPLLRLPVVEKVHLQMSIEGPYRITFLYSLDGKRFIPLNVNPVKGAYLPPWDSPPRAGLVSKGSKEQVAAFERFELRSGAMKSSEISEAARKIKAIQIVVFICMVILVVALLIAFFRHKHQKELH